MTGRRSGRSHKTLNYSKFSAGDEDDDDFMEATPPKRSKSQRKKESKVEKANITPVDKQIKGERKARNRLSIEEKYEQELQIALKISLENNSKGTLDSSDNLQPSDAAKPQMVQVQVLESPNSKLTSKQADKPPLEMRKEDIINGASLTTIDEISSEPEDNDKETRTTRSGRSKRIKEIEEEYEMNDEESDSEEDSSLDESSEESDYEETPKKKTMKIQKKSNPVVKEKVSEAPKKAVMKNLPVIKKQNAKSISGKENLPLAPKSSVFKPIMPTKPLIVSTTTPKCSPIVSRTTRFIQSGWTPPGPAGTKTSILKSPDSPNFLRVGLSRNVKLTPLHPKINMK